MVDDNIKDFTSPQETLTRYKQGEITEDECLAVIKSFPTSLEVPRYCYEGLTHHQEISTESDEKYELELPTDENFKGQIYMKVKGATFPIKTFVDTKSLAAVNIVKSLFIEPIKLLTMPQFWLPVAVTALSTKYLDKVIQSFNRIAWRVISPYILKDQHCTTFTPQFCFLIFTFLHQIGVTEEFAYRFATIISRMIEYDNAYRLRLEDMFSETSKEKWGNPGKEIKRLSKLFAERDINPNVTKKVKQLLFLVRLALLIPKNKKALKYAMNQVDLKDLQLDDQDRFYMVMRKDYNMGGMNYEERQQYGENRGWEFPKQI